MSRTYTDTDRVAALARLELNRGNVSKTARDSGVPRPTLILWRDTALEAGDSRALTVSDTEKTDWTDLYGQAARLGAEIITENLTRYRGQELEPGDLRNVAVVAGIAADKHLDYRDGRKTSQVNVDARSVNLTQLSDEQLARLADGR